MTGEFGTMVAAIRKYADITNCGRNWATDEAFAAYNERTDATIAWLLTKRVQDIVKKTNFLWWLRSHIEEVSTEEEAIKRFATFSPGEWERYVEWDRLAAEPDAIWIAQQMVEESDANDQIYVARSLNGIVAQVKAHEIDQLSDYLLPDGSPREPYPDFEQLDIDDAVKQLAPYTKSTAEVLAYLIAGGDGEGEWHFKRQLLAA